MEDFDFSECFERLFLDDECKNFKINGQLKPTKGTEE